MREAVLNNPSRNFEKMVRAWYMDDEPTDQRLEHQRNPPQFLTLEELFKITGVEYFKVTTLLSVSMTCKYAVVFFY